VCPRPGSAADVMGAAGEGDLPVPPSTGPVAAAAALIPWRT
jgi:hypothetical protein